MAGRQTVHYRYSWRQSVKHVSERRYRKKSLEDIHKSTERGSYHRMNGITEEDRRYMRRKDAGLYGKIGYILSYLLLDLLMTGFIAWKVCKLNRNKFQICLTNRWSLKNLCFMNAKSVRKFETDQQKLKKRPNIKFIMWNRFIENIRNWKQILLANKIIKIMGVSISLSETIISIMLTLF